MTEVQLVGILNITPNSFSDGGLYFDTENAYTRASQLKKFGASIIDVGAESTRPGAIPISHDEEWLRLEIVLPKLIESYPSQISLDTSHPETLARASRFGTVIANDVTAFCQPLMREVAADTESICIVSHLPDSVGGNIQLAHDQKEITSVDQVYDELMARREEMVRDGIDSEKIILDPGIGFGKTPEVNHALLSFASLVQDHDVMVGYSRKRFLGKEIDANLAAAEIAIASGAKYLRVHDVAEHYELLRTLGQL